jgi:hypothetical protein
VARQLHELRNRKSTIETRLGAIYGIEVQHIEEPKTQAIQPILDGQIYSSLDEKKDLWNLPLFRVELSKSERSDGWTVVRENVRDPPFEVMLFPFRFADCQGLVFEADQEEYPEPEWVENRRADGTTTGYWKDLYDEKLCVTRMMHLDENNGRLLKAKLNEARKNYPHVARRKRKQKTALEMNTRDVDRSDGEEDSK